MFLESDFFNDFIQLSSDETYKISKQDLQIYFLNQVYIEIEKIDKENSFIRSEDFGVESYSKSVESFA